MASTYSALKIELMGTGDQPGTWGTTTNVNLGTALEQAIVGRAATIFSADSDLTITLTDTNATQVARHFILNVISAVALTTTRNLIVPAINKPYIIENNTTGGQSIIVKTSSGTGVTVPNGSRTMVYADSVNVVAAENYKPSLALGTALPVASGGTGGTTSTGTGSVVLGTGPTISNANLTGVPTVPTATVGTDTTQAASTAFVINQVAASVSGVSTFSAGTTGFTPSVATSGAVTLGGVLNVSNGGTGVTSSTGTGSVVRATSPTLTTPNLGTPTFLNLSNATSLPLESGVTGTLGTARGGTGVTSSTGSGSNVLSISPTLTTPNLGTPTAATLTNATGLPIVNGTTGTLSVARGGTGATSLTGAGIVTTGDAQTVSGAKTFTGAFGVGSANPAAGVWAGYSRSLSATNPAFVMDGTTSANSICSAYFGGAGGGDTVLFGQFLYGSQLSNTVVGSISSTGTSTSFNTSSDRRLKKDIEPMTDGLEKTMLLKPVKYVWKINNEPSQGFIADELQQVIPEAVTGEPNGVYPDGKPKYQGMDTSFMIATLTAAIQEQQALIEALTARVAALETA
jgi:hypothetical protein